MVKALHLTSRNSTIDCLRLVAAFLVVFIHSGLHGLNGKTGFIGSIVLLFARTAVPFFFIVSGYFMYSKDYAVQIKKIRKSVPKLFNIFILSSILYFIFYGWYFGSYSFTIGLITPTTIFNMVVFNHPVYNEALWFILALIGASVLHLVNAMFLKKDEIVLLIAAVLYFISLMVSNYATAIGLHSIDASYYRNFLGEALLFTMIGYMAAKYASYITKMSVMKLLYYLAGSLILYAIEFYAIRTHNSAPADIYMMLPIFTFFVFALALRFPSVLKNTVIPYLGATLSLYIYLLHILVLYSLDVFMSRLGISGDNHKVAFGRFLLAFVLSMIIGYAYLIVKQKYAKLPKRYSRTSK